MKFDRLKASVTNNSDQQPSIYMALCMVESLFADIEDEWGGSFSQCPAGDERLTNKLLWLIRSVNGVYNNKSDDLQRNRAKLDTAMAKLQDLEKELAQHAKTADRLAEAQKDCAKLEDKLRQANEKKQRCEALVKEADRLRAEIEELDKVDLVQVEQEIRIMRSRREDAAAQARKLRTAAEEFRSRELAPVEKEVERLRSEIAGLQHLINQEAEKKARCEEERGRQQNVLSKLAEEKTQLQAQKQTMDARLNELKAANRDLEGELAAVEAAREAALRRAEEIQQRINTIRHTGLDPAEDHVKELEQVLANMERDCGRMSREYQTGLERKNQLTQSIAKLKEEVETMTGALQETQERWQRLESDRKRLDDQRTSVLKELDRLQATVENLERKEIPEARELLSREKLRREELTQELEDLKADKTRLEEQIEQLNGQLPDQQAKVKNKQAVYDSLTAAHTASSKQLETLEAQIAELRNKTDQEKLEIYRKQLEATSQQLKDMYEECRRLQESNEALVRRTEECEAERLRLEGIKKKHEKGLQAVETMLRELDLVATEKYARDARETSRRLEQMEKARKKLSATLSMMQDILGYSPVDGDAQLDDRLKTALAELKKRTDQLCEALCSCANSLKMEEQ